MLEEIFRAVPAGVGKGGAIKLASEKMHEVLKYGAKWAVENGYGWKEDLEYIEDKGSEEKYAEPEKVSKKAIDRGKDQLGTLGSGNHFLEIQVVDKIFNPDVARVFGIEQENQVTVMIHCLPENSKILTEFGYTIEIKELVEKKRKEKLLVFNPKKKEIEKACISHFWEFKNNKEMYEIITLTGKKIVCTSDHPIFTSSGWKKAEEIKENDLVLVCPFEGVEYETPSKTVIVSEEDFVKNGGTERMVRNLKKKGLLPLALDNPLIGIIARLVGYSFGDAWIGGKRPTVKFIDNKEVLERIKDDLSSLGFRSTLVKIKLKPSNIEYSNGNICFIDSEREVYQLVVTSPSFAILLKSLSVPVGKKTEVEFDVPEWIKKAPKWIKRLFLAGYFGAEMCRVKSHPSEPYRVEAPKVSLNKVESLLQNGIKFMQSIQELLKEFGVESIIVTFPHAKRKDGKISYKILLRLSSKLENMINFFSKIGCEYHREKFSSFIKALHYYRYKKRMNEKEATIEGKNFETIRITSYAFKQLQVLTFEEFIEKYSAGDLVMWDVVEMVRKVRCVEKVYDITMAHDAHNFIADGFVVSNTGSRGLGHQVATDYLQLMEKEHRDLLRKLPDRELAFAPSGSRLFYDYFGAMNAAANFAFANRQMIMHWVRESFEKVFKKDAESLGLKLIYDITHNMAKLEEHEIDGKKMKVLVHRKGATRAFGPGWPDLPEKYKNIAQPVILPGSIGTASYIMIGTKKAEEITFASIAHGAGRVASRAKMVRSVRGEEVARRLEQRGILVKAWSWKGVAEEAPEAYKNVDEVVDVCEKAGIAKKIVRLRPIACIKGD